MKVIRLGLCLAGVITILTGCGSNDVKDPASQQAAPEPGEENAEGQLPEGEDEAGTKHIDHIVTPPQEYYDALMNDTLTKVDDESQFGLVDDAQVLFVNFAGATVSKGFGAGQSFIPCQSSSTIAPPSLSAADIADITNLVQGFYNAAGAQLLVTDEQPSAGDFTTVHVGGSYRDLGCFGSGILGVAPFDMNNLNRNDVGFAFTDGVFSNRVIAETIAHEAGHSFGLDHINNNSALMYFSNSANITGFSSGTIAGSNNVQDSVAVLQNTLGVSTGNPIALPNPIGGGTGGGTTPAIPGLPNLPGGLAGLPGLDQIGAIGAILPDLLAGGGVAGFDISAIEPLLTGLVGGATGLGGIDQILAIVGIASAAGGTGGVAGIPLDLSQIGDLLGGALGGVGGGAAGIPLDLTALLGMGGFGDLDQAIGAITGLIGGGTGVALPGTGAGAGQAIGQLPDLSSLLGILGQTGTDPSAIIGSLIGSTRVVNANYAGDEREALISMLKVAYSQAYEETQTPTP